MMGCVRCCGEREEGRCLLLEQGEVREGVRVDCLFRGLVLGGAAFF